MAQFSSNLNPSAQEFIPSSRRLSASAPEFLPSRNISRPIVSNDGEISSQPSSNNEENVGGSVRTFRSKEEEDRVRRTVFVTEIDPSITELELAYVFKQLGLVIDCRICGDTRKGRRYGFVEFENENCASEALRLDGTTIGTSPGRVRVRTSLSYIIPVNPFFLPRNEVEKGKAIRTVYCRNIDREMTEEEVRDFFDQSCGEVSQMRLFGDLNSYTRNAFIEFANEDYAKAALGLSGAKLGSLILSVTASKTPIKPPPRRRIG